ncbi:MAG: DUF4397 domain-containing protein [Bacteroidetes bacterium]|nr:DUF4397 domain-containing protein [Bacteroidota bacterium]
MEINSKRKYGGLKTFLSLAISGLLFMAFISSCGKGAANSTGVSAQNIQYQVVNLSPDIGPISLYIDFQQYKGLSFYYPAATGYVVLSSIDTPFQIRSSPIQLTNSIVTSQIYFPSIDNILHPNFKYTLFVYGSVGDKSLNYKLLTDTSSTTPPLGYGKVRIINLSPASGAFDIYANGTSTAPGPNSPFRNLQYGHVSPYVVMPAGNYTFQFYPAGTNISTSTAGAVGSYQNLTVLDGRLYTLYSYGVVGHTDSLAFGVHGIAN